MSNKKEKKEVLNMKKEKNREIKINVYYGKKRLSECMQSIIRLHNQ